MKSILITLTLSFISNLAFAESTPSATAATPKTTLHVSGMHCGGCEKIIQKSFCESDEVKAISNSCNTKLVDEKAQTGEISLELKAGQKIDMNSLQTIISKAGEYKLSETAPAKKAEKSATKKK